MRILLAIIALLAVACGWHWREITRVYYVIKLFEPDRIVRNFRSMETMVQTVPVRRAGTVHEFPRVPHALPQRFEYLGRRIDLATFLRDTWTTGLVVLKDGAIADEQYFLGNTAASKVISWSIAKSLVTALVGIAIAEGRIKSIDDAISSYVPRLKGSGYDGVPIRNVLRMTSGVRFNEDYGDFWSDINRLGRAIALDASIDAFIASLQREFTSGTCFHYISVDTQALGMLVRAATGGSIASYLQSRIWERIGMESDAYWLIDRDGMELAFGGFNAVLRDYARFGQLMLNEGAWKGEQIVPRDWVRAATAASAPAHCAGRGADMGMGYGYQWWVPLPADGDYVAIGAYGQFLYVNPRAHIVIAKSSAYPDYNRDGMEKERESVAMFRAIAAHLSPR